jgi:hypothetical protein
MKKYLLIVFLSCLAFGQHKTNKKEESKTRRSLNFKRDDKKWSWKQIFKRLLIKIYECSIEVKHQKTDTSRSFFEWISWKAYGWLIIEYWLTLIPVSWSKINAFHDGKPIFKDDRLFEPIKLTKWLKSFNKITQSR